MTAVVPDPALTDWVPLGGIGGGALVPIQEITLGAGDAAFDFQSIPQVYSHLALIGQGRFTQAVVAANAFVQCNGDAGANYDWQISQGAVSAVTAAQGVASQGILMGTIPGASALASQAGGFEIRLPFYRDGSFFKQVIGFNGTGGSFAVAGSGQWRSLTAISRVRIFSTGNTWVAGSRATLYGIAPPGLTTPLGGAYYGSSPPASPYDGQEWIMSPGTGLAWRFRYNASSASSYKWEFVGGAPVRIFTSSGAMVAIGAASTWSDTAVPGPIYNVPRPGDYEVIGGAQFSDASPSVLFQMGAWIGTAVGTGFANAGSLPLGNGYVSLTVGDLLSGVSTDVRLRYWSNSASSTCGNRWMMVTPVRVS